MRIVGEIAHPSMKITLFQLETKFMVKFEKELKHYLPDVVLVPGDVNSSTACALVASRNNIKLGHIESGLRSLDRTMPEEINRLVGADPSEPSVNSVSDYVREHS